MKVVDVETRSDLDLKDTGAWIYSRGPRTGINCAVIDDKLFELNDCLPGGKLAEYLERERDRGTVFVAHNAKFEHHIFANVLKVDIPPEQWRCTQALAAYYGLPQSLDGVSKALGLDTLKDTLTGAAAMRKLAILKGPGYTKPEDEPELFLRLYSYCRNDVAVTRAVLDALPPLPKQEQAYWEMDFRMNVNGMPVDWFHLTNALEVVAEGAQRLDRIVQKLTNGVVDSARQTAKLATFLGLPNVNAETVKEALAKAAPGSARHKLLTIRQQSGLSSLAKFDAIKSRLDTDGRLRCEYWYFGAHTGRWTSAGAQVQNLPAGVDEKLCEMLSHSKVDLFLALNPKPLASLKKTVRGVVCVPEDKSIAVIDKSQIEARCTAWLGGDDDTLELYRKGEDVYCHTASNLFGKKVTKENYLERQGGKTTELSLGFAGGIGALERGAKKFNVDVNALVSLIQTTHTEEVKAQKALEWYRKSGGELPDEIALALDAIKQRWRAAHANTARYWYELLDAFKYGGDAGRISIKVNDKGTRIVKLPSGRNMFYRGVKISKDNGVSYEGRWGRSSLTPGKLFENVVQACDADIIRWYMIRGEAAVKEYGGLLIGQFHDAYGLELFNSTIDDSISKVKAVHKQKPDWADGLPIDCEIKIGRRLT